MDLDKEKKKAYNRNYYLKKKAKKTKTLRIAPEPPEIFELPETKNSENSNSEYSEHSEITEFLNLRNLNLLFYLLTILACNIYLIDISRKFYIQYTDKITAWFWAILLEFSISFLSFSNDENQILRKFKNFLIGFLILTTCLNCSYSVLRSLNSSEFNSKILNHLELELKNIDKQIDFYTNKNWPKKVSTLIDTKKSLHEKYIAALEEQKEFVKSGDDSNGTVYTIILYRLLIIALNVLMCRKLKAALET